MITPNFSEMVELESTPLPAGIWKARLTKLEQTTAKSSGAAMLKAQFTIFDCEGDLSKYNNWKISTRLMLSGKGTFMTKQFVTALELPESFSIEQALGKEALVTTKPGKPNDDGTPNDFPEVKAIQKIQ